MANRTPSAALVALVVAPLAAAAAPRVPASHQVEIPFSTAGVFGLAIAPDGAVWAAGQLGVSRFDGREMTVYDDRNTRELAGASQSVRIAIDPQGAVWVSGGAGLPYVQGRTLSTDGEAAV